MGTQSRRQPVQRTVETPDGRVLAVEDAGDPHGLPVLVHNGHDGHLTLLQNRVGEVHAWLARYLRAVTVTGTRGRDQ